MYFGLYILSIILQDVRRRIETQSFGNVVQSLIFKQKFFNVILVEMVVESTLCRNHYELNMCGTEKEVPMLFEQCQNWKLCMNVDPTFIDHSKIFVVYVSELLGDFFEGLFGRLSTKTFVGRRSCHSFASASLTCC
jgi:hypothetical protein